MQFKPSYNFTFNCSNYEFIKVNDFGLTSKLTDDLTNQANCVNFTTSMNLITDSDCKMQNYINKLTSQQCTKKSACQVTIPTSEIFSQCPILINNNYLYLSYMCHDPYIELGRLTLSRPILAYLVVCLDAASVLIMIITIIILRCDYSKLNILFKQSNRLINQYTINVKNLEIDFENVDKEVNSLVMHFDRIIRQSLKIEYLSGKKINLRNLNVKKDENGVEYIKIDIARSKTIRKLEEDNGNENNNNLGGDFNDINNNINENKEIKVYDFTNEVNFSTYIYEINYPYLSTNKLSLILKREKLLNDYIMKNARFKKLIKEKNFGLASSQAYKKPEQNNKENNDLDNQDINNFNDLNLENLDNMLDLENNNNNIVNDADQVNNKNSQEIVNNISSLPMPNAIERYEYRSLTDDLRDLRVRIFKVVSEIKTLEKENHSKVNDVLVTFLEPKYSKFIYASYNKNKCTRCCYIFCCKYYRLKRFYYKNRWLEIKKNPDNPSNIKWQNMLTSPCKKCISKFFSILLSILLILIGFGIVIGSKYFQDMLNTEFNNDINCSFVEFDEIRVVNEYMRTDIPKRNRILTYCFCHFQLGALGMTGAYNYAFPSGLVNNTKITPCQDWITAYLKFNTITYAIIIIIPILNSLITVSLTSLTDVEKNKSLTDDKSSNMFKIFVGQFINTGLNLLIVNANVPAIRQWNNNFPILNGVYQDFSSGWFKNVGCTIFFTMIISIITPHIGILLGYILSCIRRICDSCNLSGKGSKLSDLKSFMELYVGPELMIDTRYAQVIKFT